MIAPLAPMLLRCWLIGQLLTLWQITLDLMRDPVSTIDGQTYEREFIEEWLREHTTSPLTGDTLATKTLIPMHALRSLAERFSQEDLDRWSDQVHLEAYVAVPVDGLLLCCLFFSACFTLWQRNCRSRVPIFASMI